MSRITFDSAAHDHAPDHDELTAKRYAHLPCLVTGHTGFIGSWLCMRLTGLAAGVTGYALDPPTTPSLFELARIGDDLCDLRGDVRDFDRLLQVLQQTQPAIVFHLAAQPIVTVSYRQPRETFDVNVQGTVNVLEACRLVDSVRAVVVVTSDKCYENREWQYAYREADALGGRDPYSASKAAEELVCGAYGRSFLSPRGVGWATVRAGNVIGGGDWAPDRIIPDAARAVASQRAVPVRHPQSVRPWQHVLEPVQGMMLLGARLLEAAEERAAGPCGDDDEHSYDGPWNFGPCDGLQHPVAELIETFLAGWGEGQWQDLSPQQSHAPPEADRLALSCEKANTQLDWRPRWSFEQAVQATADWYRRCADGEDARRLCAEQLQQYLTPAGAPAGELTLVGV